MRTLKAIEADITRNNQQYAALHQGVLGRPHTPEEVLALAALDTEFRALNIERLEAPLPGEESPTSPVSEGLVSDDAAWSQETVEHVRATCPLSAVVAGVLDGFVARGATIHHASVLDIRSRVAKWHIRGGIRDNLFEADVKVFGVPGDIGGYWTLTSTHGVQPSVRVFRLLGHEPNTDPHNRFHVDIETE